MSLRPACSRDGAVEATPVSDCLHINTPLGRIKVVHHTLKVLQAVAAYAPSAPNLSIALGQVSKALTLNGSFLSSVTVFPGASGFHHGVRATAGTCPHSANDWWREIYI